MRRALACDFAAAGARVVMTLDFRLPDEPGPWKLVRVGPNGGSDSVVRLAARADHTILIAPETGGTLRELTRSVSEAGGDSLGSTPDAIDLTADKWRLSAHFARAGVPTPVVSFVRPKTGLPRGFPYPAVLKPVDGAGSLDTLLVSCADDPIVASFPHESGLLQPFVAGDPRSATFLGRPDAPPILLGVGRQRIRVNRGRFSYEGGTILTEPLMSDHPARAAAASVTGLHGVFGVDLLHDPLTGSASVLEINPRPTTSCVGLVEALGPARLASAWLSSLTGAWPPLTDPARSVSFRTDGTVLTHPTGWPPTGASP